MIIKSDELLDKYRTYTDKRGKIKRLVDKGELIPLVKGIYETDKHADAMFLSSYICGPSYLSFDFVLSYFDLIPERVYGYTSASFMKRRVNEYKNFFGEYYYRDVPKEVYPYGIKIIEIENYSCQMATPEKALCDKLYISPIVNSVKELKELLFEDLRIDEDSFNSLNKEDLLFLAPLYHNTTLKYLKKMLEKEKKDGKHN